jgi:hypothetical protein
MLVYCRYKSTVAKPLNSVKPIQYIVINFVVDAKGKGTVKVVPVVQFITTP